MFAGDWAIAKQEDLEAATMDRVSRVCVVVALATFLSGTSFTATDIDFAEEEFDKVTRTLQTSVHLQLPHLQLPWWPAPAALYGRLKPFTRLLSLGGTVSGQYSLVTEASLGYGWVTHFASVFSSMCQHYYHCVCKPSRPTTHP